MFRTSRGILAPIAIAVAYVALHVGLDHLSSFSPFGQTPITPWNPSAGLSFLLLLTFGEIFAPLLLLASLASSFFVSDPYVPLSIQVSASLVYMVVYGLACAVLMLPRLRFDPSLRRYQSVILLLLAGAISSATASIAYASIFGFSGLFDWNTFWLAFFRSWIGDLTGIVVITPLSLLVINRKQDFRWSGELAFYLIAIVLLGWTLFGTASSNRPEFFFLLFLPLSFVGVRFGLSNTCIANALTQATVLLFVTYLEIPGDEVTLMQSRLVVYFLASLTIGTLVSERHRVEVSIRMYQDALARVARRSSMGEVSATIAHEVNQPLTAIGNYVQLIKSMAQAEPVNPEIIRATSEKILKQVDRAAEVITRIRSLTQLRHADRKPISLVQVISQNIEFMRDELAQSGVTVSVRGGDALPKVAIDRVQIGQLLINLVRNSLEAFQSRGQTDGRVEIVLTDLGNGWVETRVRDNGPGFTTQIGPEEMASFVSTKAGGMGIGLALCRSIIEVHGGQFRLGGDHNGAAVTFTLPTQ